MVCKVQVSYVGYESLTDYTGLSDKGMKVLQNSQNLSGTGKYLGYTKRHTRQIITLEIGMYSTDASSTNTECYLIPIQPCTSTNKNRNDESSAPNQACCFHNTSNNRRSHHASSRNTTASSGVPIPAYSSGSLFPHLPYSMRQTLYRTCCGQELSRGVPRDALGPSVVVFQRKHHAVITPSDHLDPWLLAAGSAVVTIPHRRNVPSKRD